MKTEAEDSALWFVVCAGRRSQPGHSQFVRVGDDAGLAALRNRHANQGLYGSTCFYKAGHADADRIYPLYFHFASEDLELAHRSTLEAVFYINEAFSVPLDLIEISYNGAGASDRENGGRDKAVTGSAVIATGNNRACVADEAEFVLSVPPTVFGGRPTSVMPALNYHLARQIAGAGIKYIDIDKYVRDSYVPLLGCKNSSTDRFAIALTVKELLYLDSRRLVELSIQPRYESMILPRFVPEAAEWFDEVHAEFEQRQHRQDKLRELILKGGWQIPPCVRRLTWAHLDESATFEACRIISAAYSFLGSHEDEVWYHILRLARRNTIQGVREHQRLRAIITFAGENPMLPDCSHPLLKQFCPTGGCYIAELLEEYKQPHLFQGL
jgi:hypothetical protein